MTTQEKIIKICDLIINNGHLDKSSDEWVLDTGISKLIYKFYSINKLNDFIRNNSNAFALLGITNDINNGVAVLYLGKEVCRHDKNYL